MGYYGHQDDNFQQGHCRGLVVLLRLIAGSPASIQIKSAKLPSHYTNFRQIFAKDSAA